VNIDVEKKHAVVTIEESALDEAKLVSALEDAGFGGSVLKKQSAPVTDKESAVPPKTDQPADGAKPTDAQSRSSTPGAFGKHVAVGAHLDRDLLRPGDSFRVAVVVDITDGWHIYGNPVGPGLGKPTVVSVAPAEGFRFEPARYAAAHKAEQDLGEFGTTWVWEHTGQTVHYLTGHIDSDAQPAEVELDITVFGQVCNPQSCLPGSVTAQLAVRIVPKDSPTQESNAKLFAKFEQAKLSPDAEGE